jgi:hypothetical protein
MKIHKIRPMFSRIVTTATRFNFKAYAESAGIIVDPKIYSGAINDFQRVISVGTTVKDFEPGDVVKINFKRYMRNNPKDDGTELDGKINIEIDPPVVTLDGKDYLILDTADVEFFMKDGDYETDDGGLLQ